MEKIKLKNLENKTIKILNKNINDLDKFKSTKEKDDSINSKVFNDIDNYVINGKNLLRKGNDLGKNAFKDTKNNFIKLKKNNIKNKNIKNMKKQIKNTNKKIKVANKGIKNTINVTKVTSKNSIKVIKGMKQTIKSIYINMKIAIKAILSAIKFAIASTKTLISAIIAGGWIAIIIILVVCVVGMLCSSFLGIFFSSEDTSSYKISDVVQEINLELDEKINDIKDTIPHDEYKFISNKAKWEDILSIYSATITQGIGLSDVMTMDDEKASILKSIYWDMNVISYEVVMETETDIDDFMGEIIIGNKQILYITIDSFSVEEMIVNYNFNSFQINEVNSLLDEEYQKLWVSVIYGTKLGESSMVEIALGQVGQVGGEPYWSWYGFNYRIEWCAVFVSWVANELNYIENNVIPKFAGVVLGIEWFESKGLYRESSYIPNKGDIIFFDWENDGHPDHVGIVEKVENNYVYTVEGNSLDEVKQVRYSINSNEIFGYGIPNY